MIEMIMTVDNDLENWNLLISIDIVGSLPTELKEIMHKGKQVITQEEFYVFVLHEFAKQFDVTKVAH